MKMRGDKITGNWKPAKKIFVFLKFFGFPVATLSK
jgi:hypothetical protein